MSHRTILRLLGIMLLVFSATMAPPIAVSLLYQDGELRHFLVSAFVFLGVGAVALGLGGREPPELRTRDGFLVVGAFWVVLSLVSAVPFVLGPHMTWVDAIFEAVSGFTTTGATLLTNLDTLPPSLLFYRQQLQWLGGMGVIVLAVAIMPMLGVGGMQLFRAETPGPLKEEKLTPRIKQTASRLWLIYAGLTAACAVAFRLGGMSWFDAVAHALTTISTGGFSTHDASLGFFDSPAIEWIAVVFMMLGSINFALHFQLLQGGRSPRVYLRDDESRTFLLVVLGASALVGATLLATHAPLPPADALRAAAFQTVSFITTTGFTSAEFYTWPLFVPVLLVLLSFVGGCAGSTAGGMKVVRWLLILKQGAAEVRSLVHRNAVIAVRLNGQPLRARTHIAVWGFFSVYVLTFGVLMLVMMATGVDQVTAFSAVAASINNLGPGLGEVTSTFVGLPQTAHAVAAAAMLLGRLEIFTLLVLLSPSFWRG